MDIEHVVQKLSRDYVALLACDGVRSENRYESFTWFLYERDIFEGCPGRTNKSHTHTAKHHMSDKQQDFGKYKSRS